MTLQELSKYYDIQMTLEKDREALERLRQRITPASPQLTGMPHTPGVRDKVGDLAVELADMDERIGHLVSLIEPTLVTVLSLIIGAILLAVMLPMVSILTTIA